MESLSSSICILLAVTAVFADDCEKKECKGPLRFYEELNCTAVYERPGDCCAIRYDCSHLNSRSPNKCYANGKVYEIGEYLKDEDRSSACDIGCICDDRWSSASFACAQVDCPFWTTNEPGCDIKYSPDSCCPDVVCPENPAKVAKCEVEGTTYYDGQKFKPSSDEALTCQCKEGYEGKNVEPFCKRWKCGTELHGGYKVLKNCAPVFYNSPRTVCPISFRCQNDKDVVIEGSGSSKTINTNDDMKCKFGNMLMNIGDELNQGTGYDSRCVKCTCEVPPTPTCRELPDDECNITNNHKYEK